MSGVCWADGLCATNAAVGIAIVNGKLARVAFSPREETIDEVTVSEAAKYMREAVRTGANLDLQEHSTKEGRVAFLRMVEAAGSKN